LLFAVVVVGTEQGLSGGAVGVLVGAFGACILIGSFLSSFVRRALPAHAVVVLELWTWLGCAVFLVWPDVYVLAAVLLPSALAIPSTDSVVHGYRLAMTPDRLVGRVASVHSTIALVVAPLGPLLAGVLVEVASARAMIAVFAATALVLALWGTLSPSLRAAPSLDDLDVRPEPLPGELI
jgi:MFS family permease